MKKISNLFISAMLALSLPSHTSLAQTIDEERMRRDIEVAENVLATLIKQELEQQNTFFGLDVKGTYQPGYGVTFRVPSDASLPFAFTISGDDIAGATVISDGNGYRYTLRTKGEDEGDPADNAISLRDKLNERTRVSADSARSEYNNRMIRAAQNFVLDFGDFLSQLKPNERIVVTNQSDRAHFYLKAGKRNRISVEGIRGDVSDFRQGKLSREQALKKLTLVNTESVDVKEPDMEMLSSIFSRLYRPDLSKTYFVEGNVYYERLKDFGAIFYMRVVSSVENSPQRFSMPTLKLDDLDQQSRNKKVVELYPAFERDLKENVLEYGRTVKSLGDKESLIFNIQMTQCKGCGIPSTLELSVPALVLRDFGTGKLERNAAMSKMTVKKGASQ